MLKNNNLKSVLVYLLSSLAILGAVGCATTQPSQKSNLTMGTVKKNLVKGKTSQAEVMQLLGSPNLTTKNGAGNEVWTYSRQSYDSNSGSFGGGLILFGGSTASSSSSSGSFDLILTFDSKDIVQDYSVVQSQF